MANQQHATPPWHSRVTDAKHRFVEINDASGKPVVTADWYERTKNGETETHCGVSIAPSNLRLIEAAPDLLAACEAFVALFRECDMRPEDECHEVLGTMLRAIEKATTEASNG